MSKREVAKAATKAISNICKTDDYLQMKTGNEPEAFYFSRAEDIYLCAFRYSFSGRVPYSIFGHIKIVYKGLTNIMFALLQDTEYGDYFDFSKPFEYYRGVGIDSEIGRHVENNGTLYISSVEEAVAFAKAFYDQIKEEEQNFILPAVNIDNTINGFMKKQHFFWPGNLLCFMKHLVAYGLMTSNPDIIQYAFKKSEEVMPKLVGPARPIKFIETVRIKLKENYNIKIVQM